VVSFVCFLWNQDGYRCQYTAAHVNRWAAMIREFYPGQRRIICVTDIPEGLEADIEVVPPIPDHADLSNPHGPAFPSCYRRLRIWAHDAEKHFGKRIVLMDIDVTIRADIRPLFDRPEPIIIWRDPGWPTQPYNGGLVMIDAGVRPDVWGDFCGQESANDARAKGFKGSDQGWLAYKLGPSIPVWTPLDGVVSYRRHGFAHGSKMVMFHGTPKPWEVSPPVVEGLKPKEHIGMVKVIAVGTWSSTTIGNVSDGDILNMSEGLAQQMVERGYVRYYETKPEPVAPLVDGPVSESGSPPPAPRSRRLSKRYETKKGE